MDQAATGTPNRGRGRPSRLSRDQIVGAAADLLEQDPDNQLTVKRVADAVGAAPMALYRYFPDRDDLLQAVADQVLGAFEPYPLTGDTWQDRLRSWMRQSQRRMRRYNQLLPFIVATNQPVGLPSLLALSDLLRPLDLSDADAALAIALIGSANIGQAFYASHRAPVEQTATTLAEALAGRPEADRGTLAPLLAHLPDADERLYEAVLDQVVAAVERLAEGAAGH